MVIQATQKIEISVGKNRKNGDFKHQTYSKKGNLTMNGGFVMIEDGDLT